MAKRIFRIFRLTKDEIENLQIERLLFGIATEAKNRGGVSEVQGKISFEVSGYDDDPRELWKIPEARSYFKKLDKAAPFFLYFIANENWAPIVRVYLKMFIDPDFFVMVGDELPESTEREVATFIDFRLKEVASYCKNVSIAEGKEVDPEETIYQTYRCLGFDVSKKEMDFYVAS